MKKQILKFAMIICMAPIIFSCTSCKKSALLTPRDYDAELGIEAVPESMKRVYRNNFNGYTSVKAPNGGLIQIVAQNKITNEQIVRCRSILEHYLCDFPGSEFGNNKDAVANKMAENGAILMILNGQDDGSNNVMASAQALYQNEIQVEGHAWYVNQDYSHRDAAYEEILHMVHDYGIGVDGSNSHDGALPDFQAEIRAAQENALSNNLWGIGSSDWIKELTKENSLSQEYLASVIDSYYGLWGAWEEMDTHGMWGVYIAKTREDILTDDPQGEALMDNKFFHPYLTYNARIDSTFEGNFSLKFDETIPYTNHSQYLKDITLLGSKNTNITVNGYDNDLSGNEGTNTVVFTGASNEYTITTTGDETVVADQQENRDGNNTLRGIEFLEFTNETVAL